MEDVEGIIKQQIRQSGPIDIGTFMSLALGHPKFGYYITRDPIGAQGDFTTSPEISQCFGEMLTVCMVEAWIRGGKPDVHLVELGPGRGTLMADFLKSCKNAPDFFERMDIHLVETSPVLRAAQKAKLAGYTPHWHDSIDTLPADGPLLILANEFFDALPIRQAVMTLDGWREKVVGLSESGTLQFGIAQGGPSFRKNAGDAWLATLPPAPEGTIMEVSPVRDAVMRSLCARLQKQGGLMIVIDYGHAVPGAAGDTFQAVRKHKYVSPLENVGHADLTSHVDFARLDAIASEAGCAVYGPVSQKSFLEAMGIHTRLKNLQAQNPSDETLAPGVTRLIDPQGMGQLFKVMAVSAQVSFCRFSPAGFQTPS